MENIFENAKFGDKFKTRDGRMAIYHKCIWNDCHLLLLEAEDNVLDYFGNGNVVYEFSEKVKRQDQDDDIVSRWETSE